MLCIFVYVNTTLQQLSLVSYIPYCNSLWSCMEVERWCHPFLHSLTQLSVTWLVYKTVYSVVIAKLSFWQSVSFPRFTMSHFQSYQIIKLQKFLSYWKYKCTLQMCFILLLLLLLLVVEELLKDFVQCCLMHKSVWWWHKIWKVLNRCFQTIKKNYSKQ